MIDSNFIAQLTTKIQEHFLSENDTTHLISKAEIKQLLTDALSSLAIVSREEFDIQQQVLQNTRAKLDQLLKTLSTLEAAQKAPASSAEPALDNL